LSLGGIRGRTEATGRGVFFGVREALADKDWTRATGIEPGLAGKTVVVQGLGNVGYHAALFLQRDGARIIGIAEREGAIHDPAGLDVDRVVDHRRSTGSIVDFPGAVNIQPTELALELPCDILLPAALENQITTDNADNIRAKLIAEGANGPVTAEASERLLARGIPMIPDLYLNAGGVTVSYFEWIKNLSHVRFGRMGRRFEELSNTRILRTVEQLTGNRIDREMFAGAVAGANEADLVDSGLEDTMIIAWHQMKEFALLHHTDLRSAAYALAIGKVAQSYLDRGIFP
jgi:glutamate dehydrogenase (NAD(P)+)